MFIASDENGQEAAAPAERGGRHGAVAEREGATHGEIAAHLTEIYGAQVSKQDISTITDRVMEGMGRVAAPLDPVIFIDRVHVNIREDNVANQPGYVALNACSTTATCT